MYLLSNSIFDTQNHFQFSCVKIIKLAERKNKGLKVANGANFDKCITKITGASLLFQAYISKVRQYIFNVAGHQRHKGDTVIFPILLF